MKVTKKSLSSNSYIVLIFLETKPYYYVDENGFIEIGDIFKIIKIIDNGIREKILF